MVQDKLAAMSGEVILLKDLTNISAQMKSESLTMIWKLSQEVLLTNMVTFVVHLAVCVNYDIHMVVVITTLYIQNFKAQYVAS